MKRAFLLFSIIFSPFVLTAIGAAIADQFDGDRGGAPYGLASAAALIIGVPLVAIIGFIFSLITRNMANYERLSVIGYLIPAVLISGFNIFSFMGNIF